MFPARHNHRAPLPDDCVLHVTVCRLGVLTSMFTIYENEQNFSLVLINETKNHK